MIIPNHGGGSAKSRLEPASPPGRCATTRSWACSARQSGWPVGIGSMRVKIYAASIASHFSGSWAFRSQTSPVNSTTPSRDLSDTIGRHIGQVDQRLAAFGRHRERMITVRDSLAAGSPTDEELLDILHEMAEVDHGLAQRLTLLVYDDIEAVHDHLVAVFGFGPGTITRDDSGRVVHGELHVGDGVIWMHPPSTEYKLVSPASLGVSTHCMAVMVDDVDRHHERSVAAGATVVYPPKRHAVRGSGVRRARPRGWVVVVHDADQSGRRPDMSELTPYLCVSDSRAAIDLVRGGVPGHGEGQAVRDGRRAGWPRRVDDRRCAADDGRPVP